MKFDAFFLSNKSSIVGYRTRSLLSRIIIIIIAFRISADAALLAAAVEAHAYSLQLLSTSDEHLRLSLAVSSCRGCAILLVSRVGCSSSAVVLRLFRGLC